MVGMFCPKCGEENSDTNHFCGVCGASLIKNIQKKTSVFAPIVPLIIIGVLLILSMYLLPLFEFGTSKITLAQTVEYCNSMRWLGANCYEASSWMFFIGWGIGLMTIAIGFFNWKKE